MKFQLLLDFDSLSEMKRFLDQVETFLSLPKGSENVKTENIQHTTAIESKVPETPTPIQEKTENILKLEEHPEKEAEKGSLSVTDTEPFSLRKSLRWLETKR